MGSTVYPPTSAYSSDLLVVEIFPSLPKKPLEVDNGDDGFGKKHQLDLGCSVVDIGQVNSKKRF